MSEVKKQAEKLLFSVPILIQAAAPEANGTKKPATFSIRAYNGGKITVCNWPVPVVFDLNGLIIVSQQIPILDNHEPENHAVIGQTDKVMIANGGIDESGVLYSNVDEAAALIVAKAASGHQWQASVGVLPFSIEQVNAGEKVTVNGQLIDGPVDIIRTGALRETSIVVVGGDTTSTVQIAASQLNKHPQQSIIILI